MKTLDDLKRTIRDIPNSPGTLPQKPGEALPNWWLEMAAKHHEGMSKARLVAFEWREGFRNIDGLNRDRLEEYDEGMRLIAEHLK